MLVAVPAGALDETTSMGTFQVWPSPIRLAKGVLSNQRSGRIGENNNGAQRMKKIRKQQSWPHLATTVEFFSNLQLLLKFQSI